MKRPLPIEIEMLVARIARKRRQHEGIADDMAKLRDLRIAQLKREIRSRKQTKRAA